MGTLGIQSTHTEHIRNMLEIPISFDTYKKPSLDSVLDHSKF